MSDLPGSGGTLVTPGTGSGRVEIWMAVLEIIHNSRLQEIFIGHGTEMVHVDLLSHYGFAYDAHNDFLEILYDSGFVGILLYAIAIISVPLGLRHTNGTGNASAFESRVWRDYYLAYLMSTAMFHTAVYSLGPRLLTYLAIGCALAHSSSMLKHFSLR
jgi:O-antigen ligase